MLKMMLYPQSGNYQHEDCMVGESGKIEGMRSGLEWGALADIVAFASTVAVLCEKPKCCSAGFFNSSGSSSRTHSGLVRSSSAPQWTSKELFPNTTVSTYFVYLKEW